ncbi:sensor histidine kinase [Streptomyces sp. AV19]|uniref:GAF domain-containing sensor histidine kinase n=1 Tax=Streptomyces sp. AV19 TaxID=2793068 RepID=UPI0018FE4640|nr:sensor histidine kinase [Streptomyces sp. AV19]MBH1938901.1 sensor histidine kinase [Streptomyces sp. AV19]MDG4533623.1 sensor histidine kinase [Streptomyces sp. AV19]
MSGERAAARGRRARPVLAAYGLTIVSAVVWAFFALTRLYDARLAPIVVDRGALMLAAIGLVLLGAFMTVHRPHSVLGPLLIAAGTGHVASEAALLGAAATGAPRAVGDVLYVIDLCCFALAIFTLYALPLYLPGGELPRHWIWRPYLALVALWSLVHAFTDAGGFPSRTYTLPRPADHGEWARLRTAVEACAPLVPLMTAILLAGLTVMVVRWCRAPDRRQIVSLLPYVLWLVFAYIAHLVPLGENLWYVAYTAAVIWPFCAVYGIGRDHSGRLDRATRRALVALVLITTLLAVYTVLAVLVLKVFPGRPGRGALVTGAVGLALGALAYPCARGAARIVDRVYYGDRSRPYQVVRDLAERLSRAAAPGAAPQLLCDTVTQILRLPGATVTVNTRGGPRVLAAVGERRPEAGFPLTYEGGVIGSLDVTLRPGSQTLDRQDQEVLQFLADQASPALASLQLYEDLRAAREREIVAREETRRTLRRDLHDGLGPALSGARLQIDAARYAVPDDSRAAPPLDAASQGIGQAITELRRISAGLTPAALDRSGLGGALRQLVDRLGEPPHVTVDFSPDPLPRLPAAVEVAVYLIGGEALNNVVRHSGADRAELTVRVVPDSVTIEVHDNGRGLTGRSTGTGLGLRSMEERAGELGGRCAITEGEGGGVTVRAWFPPVAGPFS